MTDILEIIKQNREARGWSEYQLAERSGLPQSTISSWYKKSMTPSFASLEKICDAFSITLSQFFAQDDICVALTPAQREMLDKWNCLTSMQQAALAALMDKVICLIPGNDGHIYEMHKTEQGEFIAPKHKIIDFQAVAAGFPPALPLIPLSLMRQIIAFFRSFMAEHGQEYEALVLIYWDKWKEEYLAYVPMQNVSKAGIHASLQDNPYDDESRYIHYADIHSHNSMEAFFSSIDDADERGTGIYMVLGHLDHFYPEIAACICCGGSFVDIDPGTVVEGLEESFPPEWCTEVSHGKVPVSRVSPRKAEKTGIWGWKALDLLLGDLK